ncbi:MAG: MerR family transcriptional regulator [Peptococcia bacterium]
MEMRNCPECGKIFTYIRTNLCPACVRKDEEQFRIVRNFIARNPGVDIVTVSEETGVSEDKIIKYIKDGRIINNSPNTKISVECEVCGTLIPQGRYCKPCQERLTSGLKRTIERENLKLKEEEERKRGLRMYTRDNIDE